MGLPSIDINFRNMAQTSLRRSQRGVVAAIIKDSAEGMSGAFVLTADSQIPTGLSAVNKDYLEKIFIGYDNKPSKVIVYILGSDAEDLSEALDYMAGQSLNYLVGPADCTSEEAQQICTWVKVQRADKHTPKAVLPKTAADDEGVINFTTEEIKVGESTYSTAAYCGRIAGLLATTPLTGSCTYAVLPEVTSVKVLTDAEKDTAVDDGQFILFYDGEKVKVGRGVNSLVTTGDSKNASYKKIKIVDAVDLMQDNLRLLIQDNYIGKYRNIYDNKCLLVTAIKEYFAQMEIGGVLLAGKSVVAIDIGAQEAYLKDNGIDTSAMNEQNIKTADTGSHVFLTATVGIPDTIEDVNLEITF